MTNVKLIKEYNDSFYRDLRRFADDKTVLTNPHKGWYHHFIDNGITRPSYRDELKGPSDIADIPGMPFLYLRIDWVDIEKDEGVFDWSYVDSIIKEYGAAGYKFMFRFCTYEGPQYNATPEWVFEKGAAYTVVTKTDSDRTVQAFEPDYGDPVFQKYLDLFMAECERKFDGQDFVETVDIGTLGTWGEGHTHMGSNKVFPYEVLKWHVDLHAKHFRNTRVIVNDDLLRHAGDKCKAFAEYCRALDMGIRDDSINVEYYANKMGYDTLSCPDLFDMIKNDAPVDLEFEHYRCSGTSDRFCNGYRHIEALRGTQATYAGFHGHVSKWYAEQKNLHHYLANRLGYWYFINGFSLPHIVEGTCPVLTLNVENRGFSRAYHTFCAKVVLEDSQGNRTTVFYDTVDNQSWLPEKAVDCRLRLDLEGVSAGEYSLLVGLFEGETAVKFAMDADRYRDGLFLLDKITIE